MYPKQAVGLLIMLSLPILAMMGTFDPDRTTLIGTSASLRAEVEYAEKVPYSTNSTMLLKLTNVSQSTLDSVDIDIDTAYLSAFDEIAMTPNAERAFAIVLRSVPPGEKREVRLDMMGREAGTTKGAVQVTSAGERIRLPLSTTVLW